MMVFVSPLPSWGQDDLDAEIIRKQSQITEAVNRMNDVLSRTDEDIKVIAQRLENIKKAIHVSINPDNRTVGVYLSIWHH